MQSKLDAVPYRSAPYAKYTNLASLLDDDPYRPKYNRIENNLCVGGTWLELAPEAEGHNTVDANLVLTNDPGFMSPGNLDFRLRPESEVWKRLPGFKQIPLEKVGPRPK
jgi:hypothetical protein